MSRFLPGNPATELEEDSTFEEELVASQFAVAHELRTANVIALAVLYKARGQHASANAMINKANEMMQ